MALGITIKKVAERTGLSLRQVRNTMRSENVRFKRVGRLMLLDPEDVDRVFGFRGTVNADARREKGDIDIFRALRDDS